MYGTIAKYHVKHGHEEAVAKEFDDLQAALPDGWLAGTVYRSAGDPNEVWIAVVFESEEHYKRNAESPGMDQRYRALLDHLEKEPEWHDGHVVRHATKAKATV